MDFERELSYDVETFSDSSELDDCYGNRTGHQVMQKKRGLEAQQSSPRQKKGTRFINTFR